MAVPTAPRMRSIPWRYRYPLLGCVVCALALAPPPASAVPRASSSSPVGPAHVHQPDDGADPLDDPLLHDFIRNASRHNESSEQRRPYVGTSEERWVPGTFEIRMFEVGQGNSQLIIFPSGFTILIDVAENSWNTGRGARHVAEKVEAIMGHTHINIGCVSHWHLDHVGYAGYGGFWLLIEEGLIKFDKLVDRDGAAWTLANEPCRLPASGPLDPVDESRIAYRNIGTTGGTAERWVCYATDPANTKVFSIREVAVDGSNLQFDPPDQDAQVTVVITDAKRVTMVDGTTLLTGDNRFYDPPPSENDYCIGLLVRMGAFTYFTAGDLDGVYSSSQWGYSYNDVESVVAPSVGEVDVLLVNHHGSSHSSNQFFIDTLNPAASLISCGVANTHGHPAQTVLDRVLRQGQVFLSHICALERDYGAAKFTGGDIVVRSADRGATYTVHDTHFVSKGVQHSAVLSEAEKEAAEEKVSKRRLFSKIAKGSDLGKDFGTAIVNGDFGERVRRDAALGAARSTTGRTIPGEEEATLQEEEQEEEEGESA